MRYDLYERSPPGEIVVGSAIHPLMGIKLRDHEHPHTAFAHVQQGCFSMPLPSGFTWPASSAPGGHSRRTPRRAFRLYFAAFVPKPCQHRRIHAFGSTGEIAGHDLTFYGLIAMIRHVWSQFAELAQCRALLTVEFCHISPPYKPTPGRHLRIRPATRGPLQAFRQRKCRPHCLSRRFRYRWPEAVNR